MLQSERFRMALCSAWPQTPLFLPFSAGPAPCPSPVPSGLKRDQLNQGVFVSTILLVVLVLLLLGVFPAWPHSRGWGYGPSGVLGVLLLVVGVLALTGRI